MMLTTTLFSKLGDDMAFAVGDYLDHIAGDYCNWNKNETEIGARMREEFILSLRVDVGTKYAKIVAKNGAHSFIVMKDTKMFKRGTILKAASWNAPATNFSRGNVFDRNFFRITWTGAT